MWSFLASLIGGPIVNGLIDAYKAKLAAGNDSDRIAADLAAKDLQLQARERELATQIQLSEAGPWWKSAPRPIVEWSFALFVAKCVVWDNLLGLGTTDPLHGDLHEWAGWVMALWFGGRSAEKIASTIARAVRH